MPITAKQIGLNIVFLLFNIKKKHFSKQCKNRN
jgi:hypothetical protein